MFLKTDGAGNLSFSSDLPTTSFTGATAETSIADSDLVLIYDDSATAVRKMTKANLVSGIGASAGQVIQVVSTTKTDTFSTTSTSFTDITGLSVSITPASASNKILVIANINGNSDIDQSFLRLMRGATAISIGDAVGSTQRTSAGNLEVITATSGSVISTGLNFLDSPSTTSATTYKIQGSVVSGTLQINRSNNTGTTSSFQRTVSTITVMEIKG